MSSSLEEVVVVSISEGSTAGGLEFPRVRSRVDEEVERRAMEWLEELEGNVE